MNDAVALVSSQSSLKVNVTVTDPPSQANGAASSLISRAGSHPPPKSTPSNHAANAASIAA